MSAEEQNWVIILKRLASISGRTVPELLNSYWECETDCVNSTVPFMADELNEEAAT